MGTVIVEFGWNVTIDGVEDIDVEVKAWVSPYRPPPIAHDHDAPAFSDPGDPGSVDFDYVRDKETGEDYQDKITDEERILLEDLCYQQAEEEDDERW